MHGATATLGIPLLTKDTFASVEPTGVNGRYWRNWFGNERCIPNKIVRPSDLTELCQTIRRSEKIRAVGSSHSFSPLVPTPDTLLYTGRMNRVLDLNLNHRFVQVEGGMKLAELNSYLDEFGVTLPTFGGIDQQTMAGLTCTATHGVGVQWGSFSDGRGLSAIELVLANGELLKLRDTDRSHDKYLHAARVSLGALGVIHSLTFKVFEAHNLEEITRPASLEEALRPEQYLSSDHYKFYYFPFTNSTYMMFQNRTQLARSINPAKKWFENTFLAKVLIEGVFKAFSHAPFMIPDAMRLLTRFLPETRSVDRSYKIMIQAMPPKSPVMEFAFPAEKAARAIEVYREVVSELSSRTENPYYANFPIVVRFASGDVGNYLSHAQGTNPHCFIDFTAHPAIHGWEEFFAILEKRMIELGGRPHWGKIFRESPKKLYPQFDLYNQVRLELDPSEKFANRFIDSLVTSS